MSLPWCPSILPTHQPSARRVDSLRWRVESNRAMSTIPTPSRVTTLLALFMRMIIFLDGVVLYLTETKADSFNVIFAWSWAVHMGFVEGNVDQWQGFLWTLQFSPDVRLSNKVPWPMYHRPSGMGAGGGGQQNPNGCYSCENGWKFAIDQEVGCTRSGRLIKTIIIIIIIIINKGNKWFQVSVKHNNTCLYFLFILTTYFGQLAIMSYLENLE